MSPSSDASSIGSGPGRARGRRTRFSARCPRRRGCAGPTCTWITICGSSAASPQHRDDMTTTAATPHKIIDLIPVLDAAEVARVHADVHAARPHWTRRDPVHPFFTLGAASYLDARKGQFAHYQALARAGNPALAETFGWVHEKLRRAVSAVVGSEARYDDRLALPGFHVHLRDPAQVIPPASIHFDLQFELIDWGQIGVADGREQLSLTLAIALPA